MTIWPSPPAWGPVGAGPNPPKKTPNAALDEALTTFGSSELLHCSAIIALFEDPLRESEIEFYRHGLPLCRKTMPNKTGFLALVGSEGLKLDLGAQQIVEDASYETKLDWLTNELHRLDRKLVAHYPHMDPHQRRQAAKFRY